MLLNRIMKTTKQGSPTGTVCNVLFSVMAHASIIGVGLLATFLGSFFGDIPAVEANMMSISLVNAGSGSGSTGELGQAAMVKRQEASEEAVPDEPQPVEETIVEEQKAPPPEDAILIAEEEKKEKKENKEEVKKTVEPPPKKKKTKPAAAVQAPKTDEVTSADSDSPISVAGIEGQAAGGDGSGVSTGRGSAASIDSGEGGGAARQTALSYLRAMISRHKRYPRAARSAGIEGVVEVRAVINASGHLVSFKRLHGTGPLELHQATDEMAIKVLENWKAQRVEKPITVVVPIRYILSER